MDLTIEGHKYVGSFEIEAHSIRGTDMVDTEVGQHPESWSESWFKGYGSITNKKTGERERFLFSPNGASEENIIILGDKVNKDKIKDYKCTVDLALGLMYEEANKSDRPVPSLPTKTLSLEMLTHAKLI